MFDYSKKYFEKISKKLVNYSKTRKKIQKTIEIRIKTLKSESKNLIKNILNVAYPYMAVFLVLLIIGFTVYTNKTSSQTHQDLGKYLLYPNVKEIVKSKKVVSIDEAQEAQILNDKTDTIIKEDAITTPEIAAEAQGENNPITNDSTSDDENIVYLASLTPVEIYIEGLEDDADSCDYKEHKVVEGETVQSIAEIYAVSVNTVLFENNLNPDDIIQPGKSLFVPCLTNAAKHTVRKGETLTGISQYHEVEIEKIMEFNTLENAEAIKEGDLLIIPGSARVIELIEDQLASKEAEQARKAAEAAAQKKLAAAQKAPKKSISSTKSTSSSSSKSSTPTKIVKKGYYILPVGGTVNYRRGIHANNGIDISGNGGASVLAAASGTVVKAACGWNGGYGCVVEVKHSNGTKSRYAHLRSGSIAVRSGQKVGQGKRLGSVGSTGRSSGNHLHFEVHGARNPYLR